MQVVVTTGAVRHADMQTHSHSSENVTDNKPTPSFFYGPDALPVAQPTVSKHWMEKHWSK